MNSKENGNRSIDVKLNKIDYAVLLGKGIFGVAPYVGTLIAEMIGTFIPNQRIDRLIDFVKMLENKIDKLDEEYIKVQFKNPRFVDIVEDAFWQAARSLTEERKEYIASFIKNSLSEKNVEYIQKKNLLTILGELNDIEILILKSKTFHVGEKGEEEFWKRHENVLIPPPAYIDTPIKNEDLNKSIFLKSYTNHLVRIGLLEIRFKKLKKGEIPEFDENTGMIKAQGYSVTSLGYLLLKSIDLVSEEK